MSAKAPGAGEDGEGAGAARVRAWRPTRLQPTIGSRFNPIWVLAGKSDYLQT